MYKRYRNMGFVCLNNWFDGCEGHHIDKIHIIHIPKKLHKSFWHNHKIPETMKNINFKAFLFLYNTLVST